MDMTVEVPELPELTFDEASHIYRLNGDIIPSVSKLMEPLKDQCYGGISKRTLENAAIKGSAVHNSIENWIKFGIDDIPSEHRGYFNGFMEWWKQYKPRVFGSEVRIYHKLMRYGGTIDLLCEIGGLLELIDFKTTYTLLEMACGVQLEAYLRENGIEVDDVAAEKPPAKVYVDDRALLFDGNPKGLLEKIQQFRPWQEGGPLRGKPPVPNCRKCIAHVYERTNDGWREDEFVAWFHTWGSTFEEFDNGAVPVTTGIVEDEHGKVWNTAAENIRFID